MKEMLMEWIITIAVFSLLVSVAVKLLPGKSYLPYIRLFAGFVTILLILQPLLSILGLEKNLLQNISKELYEVELKQMESELLEMEEKQKEKLEQMYQDSLGEQQ